MFADEHDALNAGHDGLGHTRLQWNRVLGRLCPPDVAGFGRLGDVHGGDVQFRCMWLAIPIVAAQDVTDEDVRVRVAVVSGDDGGDAGTWGGGGGCGGQGSGGEEGSTFHGDFELTRIRLLDGGASAVRLSR